jgi:hypothetical protein
MERFVHPPPPAKPYASQQGSSLVSQWEASILKWPNMASPTAKEAPDGCKLLQCTIANGGLAQPANERPVCCAGGIWITHAVGRVRNLVYLAFACQMRWTGEVSIIITLDWKKHIRVVKLCMTFESGPECILTHFWSIYDSVLIQCMVLLATSLPSISESYFSFCVARRVICLY